MPLLPVAAPTSVPSRMRWRCGMSNEASTDASALWALSTPSLWESPEARSIPTLHAAIEQVLQQPSADLEAAHERVRVVEGERDAAMAETEMALRMHDVQWSRAESAEAAHAALVKVLDEYFDFDVDPWDDHDAACPAPEDVWRLHRDHKAAREAR